MRCIYLPGPWGGGGSFWFRWFGFRWFGFRWFWFGFDGLGSMVLVREEVRGRDEGREGVSVFRDFMGWAGLDWEIFLRMCSELFVLCVLSPQPRPWRMDWIGLGVYTYARDEPSSVRREGHLSLKRKQSSKKKTIIMESQNHPPTPLPLPGLPRSRNTDAPNPSNQPLQPQLSTLKHHPAPRAPRPAS